MKFKMKNLNKYIQIILIGSGILSAFVSIITLISRLFKWGSKGFFQHLQNNFMVLWMITLTIIGGIMFFWIVILYKRYISGFRDKFCGNINDNWDFKGEWRIVDKSLIVTKSGDGGLCKKGALWENYTLHFKAKIIKDCIGVIVRAQDLNNYYMFQIRNDCIRPHRRASVPEIVENLNAENNEGSDEISKSIRFKTGWDKYDNLTVKLEPSLSSWFDVQINVSGESVKIYVNEEIVFQQEYFLKNPIGKIGFRNANHESAQIKYLSVDLHN